MVKDYNRKQYIYQFTLILLIINNDSYININKFFC